MIDLFGEERRKMNEYISNGGDAHPLKVPTMDAAVNWQEKINALQTQINSIVAGMGQIAQMLKAIQAKQEMSQNASSTLANAKYKTVDGWGHETFFYKRKDLLRDLDIKASELTKHLDGQKTVLDEIGVYVVELCVEKHGNTGRRKSAKKREA